MMKWMERWLPEKWRSNVPPPALLHAYLITFSSPYGRAVLQDLIDEIYCVVIKDADPTRALILNARRSVVHDILLKIDMAEHPQKYGAVEVVIQEPGNG